jgi:hypothetical protein
MRLHAIAAGMLGLLVASASAQQAGTGRYQVQPSVDGFIRLDTETGAVSHCARRDNVWRCDVLAADRSAIEAVAAEVKVLSDRLDALSARIDALEARGEAVTPPPETGEIEPAPGFAETLLQRLFQLVRDMKGGQQQSS